MARPPAEYAELIVAPQRALEQALPAATHRRRYRPFERLPAGYDPEPFEVCEFLLRPQVGEFGAEPLAALFPEDTSRLFHWAQLLSEADGESWFLALIADPVNQLRFKLYQAGEIRAKVGDEPEHELFYEVQQSDREALERAAQQVLGLNPPHHLPFGQLANGATTSLFDELFRLKSESWDTYREILARGVDSLDRYLLFLKRDSPLLP